MLKLVVDNERETCRTVEEDPPLESMDYLEALESLREARDTEDLTDFLRRGRRYFAAIRATSR